MKVGVISDTHGKINAEVFELFSGVDQIWHAGDIGDVKVISDLQTIAPVIAVYGNMDKFPIISTFPHHQKIEIAAHKIYLTHEYLTENSRRLTGNDINFDLNFSMIVYGHTHVPFIERKRSVIYFNPGSATYPRNRKKSSVGFISLNKGGAIATEIKYF